MSQSKDCPIAWGTDWRRGDPPEVALKKAREEVGGNLASDCFSAQTDWRCGRCGASPVLEPIGDVISQRANDANCQPGPEDAEQQHRIRALYKFLVDQMRHKLPLLKSPFLPRNVTPDPSFRLSP